MIKYYALFFVYSLLAYIVVSLLNAVALFTISNMAFLENWGFVAVLFGAILTNWHFVGNEGDIPNRKSAWTFAILAMFLSILPFFTYWAVVIFNAEEERVPLLLDAFYEAISVYFIFSALLELVLWRFLFRGIAKVERIRLRNKGLLSK